MAPRIKQVRETLQIPLRDAAEQIGLSEADYKNKEDDKDEFSKDELIGLYNYFTALARKRPPEILNKVVSLFT